MKWFVKVNKFLEFELKITLWFSESHIRRVLFVALRLSLRKCRLVQH